MSGVRKPGRCNVPALHPPRYTAGMIVTIDGPAGSGKSTAARRLAERLGFRFLNTGAMYRAVAVACADAGVDVDDPLACGAVARRTDPDRFQALADAGRLSDPAVSVAASRVARHPPVREALVALQRAFGAAGDTVTEGRDQGTVVFPDAELKVYLTASPEARADRRRRELLAAGRDVPLETVLEETRARDARDEARPLAPLKPADDAVTLDSSGRTIEQVVDELAALAARRRGS